LAILNWSNEYSVEVLSIDKEHKTLFAMLNELHDAMKAGKGSAVVPVILKRLVVYTREHFAHEEKLMSRARYPDIVRHKAEHDQLTGEVVKTVQDFEDGKTVLSIDLLEFLRSWLQEHIVGWDKKYSSSMLAAGVR
jgi:hemerythrin